MIFFSITWKLNFSIYIHNLLQLAIRDSTIWVLWASETAILYEMCTHPSAIFLDVDFILGIFCKCSIVNKFGCCTVSWTSNFRRDIWIIFKSLQLIWLEITSVSFSKLYRFFILLFPTLDWNCLKRLNTFFISIIFISFTCAIAANSLNSFTHFIMIVYSLYIVCKYFYNFKYYKAF